MLLNKLPAIIANDALFGVTGTVTNTHTLLRGQPFPIASETLLLFRIPQDLTIKN